MSMTVDDQYHVAIKPSAREVNDRVTEMARRSGTISFASRAAAEAFADGLSTPRSRLRIQRAAPQDPQDVDAYLVADGQVNEWEPIDDSGDVTTFPVGGNVYGRLGIALLTSETGVPPALRYFFSQGVPDTDRGDVVDLQVEPDLPEVVADTVRWRPDLRISVESPDRDVVPRHYFAEVKAGQSSFERTQRRDMLLAADAVNVLKIRVFLEDLPDEYAVKIQRVSPDQWPD